MNRKQRRALASRAGREQRKQLKHDIELLNERYRREINIARADAERALWTLLADFDIDNAKGRWWANYNLTEKYDGSQEGP